MQETWVRSLGWEDPLEVVMVTYSCILAWRISMVKGACRAACRATVLGSQRVGHYWETKHTRSTNVGLPWWLSGKEHACQHRRHGFDPGLGRSPGVGNGNPPQYSCLGNSTDSWAWWTSVHGVTNLITNTYRTTMLLFSFFCPYRLPCPFLSFTISH